MNSCRLCRKAENAKLFKIPKDEEKRKEWSKICGFNLKANERICENHFSSLDIIKRQRKTFLNPCAVPCIEIHKKNDSTQDIHLERSRLGNLPEDKTDIQCRCCTTPAKNFVQLDSCTDLSPGMKKTYKDLLYEITKFRITIESENKLPQQICLACENELKISYKFIQQACIAAQQYIKLIDQTNIQDDVIKTVDNLQESLIEIAETVSGGQLKVEPINIQYNRDVKEEKTECDVFMPVLDEEKSEENMHFLQSFNANDQSSDEEDTDDPESVKDFDTDLNIESVARSCDVCHKIYRNEKFLKIHKHYTHMPEENKRPCPLCTYKASRISAVKVHLGLVHGHDKVEEYFKPTLGDATKKYPCSICSRSYGRKDSLRKHMRRKHLNISVKDEEPKKLKSPTKPKERELFLCTYCGQSYNSKSGLQSHALTHTGERPFSCEICCKTFKRLKDLQLHRVIHSDEKPYQCTECGKAFKRVDKLKIHMRVHSELRPYKCNECEKTFKYPSVLRTHMHIHTGQTPFSCKTCGEAFSLRTSLNNHCLKNGHVK